MAMEPRHGAVAMHLLLCLAGAAMHSSVLCAAEEANEGGYAKEHEVNGRTLHSLEYEVSDAKAVARRESELRFVVGVNSAVDLIVSGTELMDALGLTPTSPAPHEVITSREELAEVFLHSFSSGTAFERSFVDGSVYRQIVRVAMGLKKKELFTGGNAALIGQHLVETAGGRPRKVRLVSAVGPQLKKLLHKDIEVPGDSEAEEDEVHLILEYKLGEKWGSYTAPRANRFIFSNDRTNAMLLPLEGYPAAMQDFGADGIVFSGVHMMEGEQPDYRTARLEAAKEFFLSIPPETPSHLELASLSDSSFITGICDLLVTNVNSLGLNEQELKLIALATDSPHKEELNGSFERPSVDIIADLLYHVLSHFGASGRLSRVHFHTLSFHIIGTKKGVWDSPRAATAWGSLSTSQRACKATTHYHEHGSLEGHATLRFEEKFRLHRGTEDSELGAERTFNPDQAVISWERGDMEFALVPVLVCTPPEKTVGLGDAISAAGLELHTFLGAAK